MDRHGKGNGNDGAGQMITTEDESKISDIQFQINVLRNDMKMMKQFLKTTRVDLISKLIEDCEQFKTDIDIVKEGFGRTVKRSELEE